MKITDVRVRKVDTNNKLKAVASITFDDAFVVHDIKIIEGNNGLFVAMPSRRRQDGSFKDVAHPIVADCRKEIEKAILDIYNSEDFQNNSDEKAEEPVEESAEETEE